MIRITLRGTSPSSKKNPFKGAVAATMASLFVVMFWAQLSGVAIAFAQAKAEGHVVASDHIGEHGRAANKQGIWSDGHSSQEKPMGETLQGHGDAKKSRSRHHATGEHPRRSC